MLNTKFATPLNRLGFVIFCGSMALCLIAFSITYQTYYDVSLRWLAHLRKRLPNTSCTSPFGVDRRSKHPVEAIALFGFDGSLLPLCS